MIITTKFGEESNGHIVPISLCFTHKFKARKIIQQPQKHDKCNLQILTQSLSCSLISIHNVLAPKKTHGSKVN